ncbi:MAG: TetR/AcrR family transcriptional regulator [Kofleriaceae bacterium]|nr:TetR/AcrR family transcriptional regulator [Myxococcales bacterium]MCB9565162.1 TetR/AcrR family transcriptional regulator [Kofleriaceae bacterium]MCB9572189.1 TetR/AcrR family transcriptional regulator [Kofleriaceae bacterium]
MRANTRVLNSRSKPPRKAAAGRVTARKQPSQQRSRDTVEAILTAAARVLVQHGYDGASTNRIAEVAGVSVGSLYQYFPAKEAIVTALIDRHSAAMWAAFVAETEEVGARPLAEAVPRVIDALWAAHGVEPRLHRVLHEQVPRIGRKDHMREINRRATEVVRGFLDGHAAEIRVRDLDAAAFVVVEAVEALIHASLHVAAAARDPLRHEACALVLRYLGVADARG